MSFRSVIVEADGGSRGNPGPAAYGALLKDAETGEVIAEGGEMIGTATNNVAEYRGLIAGLELAAEHAPEAEIEVRMDSKLVVEQMAGNWKIKHPSMKPLAMEANRLAPTGTTFTWVPRAENVHADRLANEALDGGRGAGGPVEQSKPETPARGWGPPQGKPTTLVLVRHGVTDATNGKLFSGGLASSNPPLNDEGRGQARATGEWLAPMAGTFDALVSSPVRRTRETAEILARVLRPRDRGGARHRRDGVRHLGRDELHRGPREVARRARLLARATSSPRPTEASRSVPWRSGCWRVATGSWRRTPGRRSSWSAT